MALNEIGVCRGITVSETEGSEENGRRHSLSCNWVDNEDKEKKEVCSAHALCIRCKSPNHQPS